MDFPGYPRNAPINFVIENKAYIGFGNDPLSAFYYSDFGVYDPETDTWLGFSVPSIIPERSGCIGFAIGNKGYIGVGINLFGVLTDLWEFNPEIVTSIQTKTETLDFTVFPVPTANFINIESKFIRNATCIIIDLMGKKILEKHLEENKTQIDMSNILPGVYTIRISCDKFAVVKKIIKE